MSKLLEQRVNRALGRAGLKYTATYIPPEDETVDGEIEVRLFDQPTHLSLQIDYEGYAIVEHGFENGELAWGKEHKTFDRGEEAAAISALVAMIANRAAS
jgi:hypothetical protein